MTFQEMLDQGTPTFFFQIDEDIYYVGVASRCLNVRTGEVAVVTRFYGREFEVLDHDQVNHILRNEEE